MTDEAREAALMELLWQWERFGRSAYTEDALMEVCGFTKQQAVAFMHWARGQVLQPGGRTYRCIVQPGMGIGSRWLRFREVLPDRAQEPQSFMAVELDRREGAR